MKIAKLVLACLLILASQATVKADYGNLGLAYLFGYGGYGRPAIQTYSPAPPYFAMHPPVYYGERYTRPYGASPFAAWPQLQPNPAFAPTPHVSRAQTISNPHASGGSVVSAQSIVRSRTVQPLEIENPYFTAEAVFTSTK